MSKAAPLTVSLLGTLTAALALAAAPAAAAGQQPSDVPASAFAELHSPTAGDPNRFLVLGGVEVAAAPAELPADLRALLGRWEGYNTNPPVRKDLRLALVIRSIEGDRADAFVYYGYNLQFPTAVKHLSFTISRTASGVRLEAPLQAEADPGAKGRLVVVMQEPGKLAGEIALGGGTASYVGSTSVDTIALARDRSYFVYRDYPAYLAGLGIRAERYQREPLRRFGDGYLVYLPPGYEAEPGKRWPLLLFLHGMGDRGDNVLLLAKASPYKMIREQGPLPFVIVAPLLSASPDFFSFPGAYLDGVLDELAGRYRIDARRVYLAGLSLGGEAAFRYSLEHPERIAAMASLGGMLARHVPAYYRVENQELAGIPLGRLADVPAWQIHGTGDAIVPVQLGRRLVEEFARVGVKVKFTELTDHEHDVWSDTFADPEFYRWFLQHEKR